MPNPNPNPMPDLDLPPRLNGEIERLSPETRKVVIIGANGAGKSRFTRRLATGLGDRAYRLNALDALYSVTAPDPEHNTVDRLHQQASTIPAYDKERPQTRLERLMSLLVSDELAGLFRFKFSLDRSDDKPRTLPSTRMDRLIAFWREVFPGNRVLVDTGNVRFGRDDSDDTIDDSRLYFMFVRLAAHAKQIDQSQAWQEAIDQVLQDYAEPIPGARDRIAQVLRIMLIAYVAARMKDQAETLLTEIM